MTPATRKPSIGVGFIVIGSELATFCLLGVVLDYAFDSKPWLTVIGTLLGFVAAVWLTLRLLKAEARAKAGGR